MNHSRVHTCLVFFMMIILCGLNTFVQGGSSMQKEIRLFPEIEPHRTGHLRVSDIHRIYYEVSGNPQGTPIFILHGGPGDSSYPRLRRLADPGRFMIVLHDQRGAGQSLPANDLRENTTRDLVEDIERLRKHLKVDRMILMGGSWGATLAVAYAETHPRQVAGMVLRGVFLATRGEIDHIFHGGVATFFPEVYREFLNALPEPDARPLHAHIYHTLHSGDEVTRRKIARAWGRYTIRISSPVKSEKEVEEALNSWDSLLRKRASDVERSTTALSLFICIQRHSQASVIKFYPQETSKMIYIWKVSRLKTNNRNRLSTEPCFLII